MDGARVGFMTLDRTLAAKQSLALRRRLRVYACAQHKSGLIRGVTSFRAGMKTDAAQRQRAPAATPPAGTTRGIATANASAMPETRLLPQIVRRREMYGNMRGLQTTVPALSTRCNRPE
jgi:hypothetical protein